MAEHTLPPLPYTYDALEPHIDKETMTIHHDKHHAAYVNNLNAALKTHPDLQAKSSEQLVKDLDSVPQDIRMAVRNNAGGDVNHTFFWNLMTPGGAKEPTGDLATAIHTAFSSLDNLKTAVNDAGAKRFGSGWSWLVADRTGALTVMSTPNQDSPLTEGHVPVLGVDVWEHAYYLKYQNRRPEYLTNWWSTVNWDKAAENYAKFKAA